MADYSSPLISVIVPVHNTESYLPECINSVLSQTYEHIALLLIDDGSWDGSTGICDSYVKKDPRVSVIHQSNSGVSKTRNLGMRKAAGDYILFLDADDILKPDCIQKLYNAMDKTTEDAITICNVQLLCNGIYTDRPEPLMDYVKDRDSLYETYLKPLITGKIQGSSCRVLYPASLLKKHGIEFSNCRIAEDLLFFMKVVSVSARITVCKESLYIYRQFPQSSSHRAYIQDYLPDRLLYLKELQNILSEIPLDPEQRRWLLSFSFQFYRMLLYMNATAGENPRQERKQIDRSIFGTAQISKDEKKEFRSYLKKNHKVLDFLICHQLFFLISLMRTLKRGR